MVDLTRFELVTSRLSAGRSNQLSYRSIAPGDNTPPARLRQPLFFIAWGASGICTSVHRPRSTMNREPKASMDSLWWFPCKKNRWSLHIPTLWRFASGRPSRVPARYKVLTRFPQDRCEGHARWTRYARLPAMQGRQPMVRSNNAGHRAAKRPKTLINHTSARRARSAPQPPPHICSRILCMRVSETPSARLPCTPCARTDPRTPFPGRRRAHLALRKHPATGERDGERASIVCQQRHREEA